MKFKISYILFIFSFLLCTNSYGAFPLKRVHTLSSANTAIPAIALPLEKAKQLSASRSFFNKAFHSATRLFSREPDDDGEEAYIKKDKDAQRKKAVILGIAGLFLFVYGLHRISYNYFITGILQLLGGLCLLSGILLFAGAIAATGTALLASMLVVVGCAALVWDFVDLIKIAYGTVFRRALVSHHKVKYDFKRHSYK